MKMLQFMDNCRIQKHKFHLDRALPVQEESVQVNTYFDAFFFPEKEYIQASIFYERHIYNPIIYILFITIPGIMMQLLFKCSFTKVPQRRFGPVTPSDKITEKACHLRHLTIPYLKHSASAEAFPMNALSGIHPSHHTSPGRLP